MEPVPGGLGGEDTKEKTLGEKGNITKNDTNKGQADTNTREG